MFIHFILLRAILTSVLLFFAFLRFFDFLIFLYPSFLHLSHPVACPEILKGKEYLGPGVDIWAMGIILYCLVVGRQPWDGHDASSIINSILDDGLEIPDGISDGTP
jgi:serine/threonine protein kinase